MKRDFYIYNPVQANYFLQRGLIPVEIGKLKRSTYVRFKRDSYSEEVFTEWCMQGKNKTLPVSGSKNLKMIPVSGSKFSSF